MNQIEKVARDIAQNLGPFTMKLLREENYSGEHREWYEEIIIPRDADIVREITQAAIAAMQPAPQWQKIESAPPPPNTRVLIAWQDWRDGKWLIEAATYETGERVGPYSNVSRHGSATHWMPLPTTPTGGSDAE